MQPAAGQEVLHYRLVAEIGRGGMGSVFRAEDTKLRRTVAVKILHDPSGDEGDRRRLLREARLASAMSHPNVVTIHALESTGSLDFIVMEYVEGVSLKSMIERGPLEARVVARLGSRLADALEAAHRQGILHRDVKPSNVLVTPAGEAKLVDFGVARPLRKDDATGTASLDSSIDGSADDGPAPSSDASREGSIVGTVAYMSPEQVRGDPLDGRSDVFSLGATLYEALTGKRPFEGASPVWIGHAILHADPQPPSSVRPDLPAAIDAVVARALAKPRDARYRNARELADALTRLQTDIDMGRVSVANDTADFDPVALVPSLGKSGRTRIALFGAAALLGIGTFAWVVTRVHGVAGDGSGASAVAAASGAGPTWAPRPSADPAPSARDVATEASSAREAAPPREDGSATVASAPTAPRASSDPPPRLPPRRAPAALGTSTPASPSPTGTGIW